MEVLYMHTDAHIYVAWKLTRLGLPDRSENETRGEFGQETGLVYLQIYRTSYAGCCRNAHTTFMD